MDIFKAKKLSYESMRKLYKSYLQSQELGKNTIGTVTGDTFYLWNNGGKDLFWDTVTSENFEEEARKQLYTALSKNSRGNVDALINGYLSNLRRFRNYIFSADVIIEEQDDAAALKDFLLDIDCLAPLDEWTNNFNMFDILKITRTEIRHSNMLSWLLNPNENHGLGEKVLKGFIQFVVNAFYNVENPDIFNILLMDCHDFILYREWHSIDVMAVSNDHRFVLCIENKIDTGEHDDQLNRYRRIIEDTFPEYRKMYIYLSPEGNESSDTDNWCSMSYQDVLQIVEKARNKVKLLPDAALLIDNYIQTIRRDIVGDENLAKICAEIYAKHQKALDLIFENKPDKASDLTAVIMQWAKEKTDAGEIEVVTEKSAKKYTRFKTPIASRILPDAEEGQLSSWNTLNHYFYEILNIDGNEFYIQFVVNSRNLSDEQREMCEKINELHPSKQQKENWQWRTHFTTKHSKVDDDISEEKIFEQLDKKLDEIKNFEKILMSELGL